VSALEQLVRVDLVSPAEEMWFGIIVRRAENREALLWFIGGRTARQAPPYTPVACVNATPFRFAQTAHMQALRWIGHFYGPGALIIYFAGYALGIFSRRTVVQDTQVSESQTQGTVSPGT